MERLFLYITYAAGNSTYYLLPVIASALAELKTLSGFQIAVLLSVEVAMKTLASLATRCYFFRWLSKTFVIVLILITLVANFATAFVYDFVFLLLMRLLSGAAYGILTALIYYKLGRSSKPDKAYSMALITLITLGALLLIGSSLVGVDLNRLFLLVSAVSLLPLLLCPWLQLMPEDGETRAMQDADGADHGHLLGFGFASIFLFFCAMNIIWVSLAGIGEAYGLNLEQISLVLALSLALGFAGASASMVVARYPRWRLALFVISAAGIAVCLGAMLALSWPIVFVFSVLAFDFFYALVIPIQSGMIAYLDRSGKAAMLIPVAQGMGLATGAWLPGLINSGAAFQNVINLSLGVLVLSVCLFIVFYLPAAKVLTFTEGSGLGTRASAD